MAEHDPTQGPPRQNGLIRPQPTDAGSPAKASALSEPRVVPRLPLSQGPRAMGVVIAVAALYFARDVLIPFALAMLLTFLLAPLVRRLERVRMPRVAAVLLLVGLST